jgi:hypothetical protein
VSLRALIARLLLTFIFQYVNIQHIIRTKVPVTKIYSSIMDETLKVRDRKSGSARSQGVRTMGLDEILKEKREEILRIAMKYGARNVRIFGSVARGEGGPDSDVDMLVEMDPGHSLLDRVALIQDLQDLIGHKVDVVTEKGLHWYIRDRVQAEAVPL